MVVVVVVVVFVVVVVVVVVVAGRRTRRFFPFSDGHGRYLRKCQGFSLFRSLVFLVMSICVWLGLFHLLGSRHGCSGRGSCSV